MLENIISHTRNVKINHQGSLWYDTNPNKSLFYTRNPSKHHAFAQKWVQGGPLPVINGATTPYKFITGLITPIHGVITLLITLGTTCGFFSWFPYNISWWWSHQPRENSPIPWKMPAQNGSTPTSVCKTAPWKVREKSPWLGCFFGCFSRPNK